MVRYLTILNFTPQGIADIRHSTKRAASFRESVAAAGGKVLSLYWAMGESDGCIVFEAPDDEKAAALLLGLVTLGNVRTRSTRVFDDKEFDRICNGSGS